MVRATVITVGRPMSQPRAATGSASAFGTAMAGGCAASASAVRRDASNPSTPRLRSSPLRSGVSARKNLFLHQLLADVYSKLTVLRFLARQSLSELRV